MAETAKAHARRLREGFFQKYLSGVGIDIGCGDDPVTPDCEHWDKAQGDATYMAGLPDNRYDWVYASHVLEHLDYPHDAIHNWHLILRTGGYMILFLPHRDLYEKRTVLPSHWNEDHRHYWLPDRSEPPCTIGLIPFISQWLGDSVDFVYCKVCDEGHTITDPNQHSDGEYSIECVVRKRFDLQQP